MSTHDMWMDQHQTSVPPDHVGLLVCLFHIFSRSIRFYFGEQCHVNGYSIQLGSYRAPPPLLQRLNQDVRGGHRLLCPPDASKIALLEFISGSFDLMRRRASDRGTIRRIDRLLHGTTYYIGPIRCSFRPSTCNLQLATCQLANLLPNPAFILIRSGLSSAVSTGPSYYSKVSSISPVPSLNGCN